MTTNGEHQPRPPLFQRIRANNLLSFGPSGIDLELGPLNVLIGPNGSGKSNLLDAISLFQAAPSQLAMPVRLGGGAEEWIWKGTRETSWAVVDAVVFPAPSAHAIWHHIAFGGFNQVFWLGDEQVVRLGSASGAASNQVVYEFRNGQPVLVSRNPETPSQLPTEEVKRDESILSQRKDPYQFPDLGFLSWSYSQIRLYRETQFGRGTVFGQPQSIDVVPRPLAENYANLWMFLSKLRQTPRIKSALIEKIADIYEGVTDFELNIEGGTVQLFLTEGDYTIPATRLSDGTLRYLCLLAILLDPTPPPFIAIEEPEIGIHPDLMPQIVELLVDASKRTQLVVTTHNDTIVDALNDRPEAVVVCEKHDGQTEFKRLDKADLAHWLEKYRLGELWVKGAIGGTRW